MPEPVTPKGATAGGGLADRILAAAVAGIGGHPRPGQQQMAAEVGRTLDNGEHLLVQAGTGTGK